jgi:selenocysteine lyase/cysteine desulfurase
MAGIAGASAVTQALAEVHREFPGTERWTYMDVAGRCILSRGVRTAMDAHLDERMYDGGNKPRFFEMVEETRRRFARLIHAEPGEVAYTKNISDGLNMIAAGFPWQPGDNVVFCPEVEHPNNIYPWLNLRAGGVEVRAVPGRNDAVAVEDLLARVDDRTRVVTVSTVLFAPGFRTDIDRLGRACRERGVMLVVDAAQSVGVLETDVHASAIDALAASTQKGLLGLYGMGFLYCRREWAERMRPAYLARFGVDLGDSHEAAVGDFTYRLRPGALRFDLGNYNFVAAAAAHESLRFLLELGVTNIERYVLGLSHTLAQGLLDLGLPVCGGQPGPHLAHIVTAGQIGRGGHDSTDDPRFGALHTHLAANRVKLSIRKGALRFSLHVYNTARDVERVLDLVKQAW